MIIFKLVSFGIQLFIAVIILALLWLLLKLFFGWIMCHLIDGVGEKPKKISKIKIEKYKGPLNSNYFNWIVLTLFSVIGLPLIMLSFSEKDASSFIIFGIICLLPCPFIIKAIIDNNKKNKSKKNEKK